jgi:hypothetical protein
VGLSGIVLVVAIQLLALLLPIVAGLAGVISGALAGLASIVAWAGLGVPASYAVTDRIQAIRRARWPGLAAVVTLPSAHA